MRLRPFRTIAALVTAIATLAVAGGVAESEPTRSTGPTVSVPTSTLPAVGPRPPAAPTTSGSVGPTQPDRVSVPASSAQTPSSSATTSSTTPAAAPTTKPAPPAPRLPWFALTASWNRPVSDFGPSPDLQQYAERLWNFGGGAAPPGTVNVAFGDYSVPVYPLSEATTTARVYQTTWAMELYDFGLPLGTRIPWNPAWRAGTGNDNILAIVDETTGRAWEIGGVGQANVNCASQANVAASTRANDWQSVYLCISGIRHYDNLYTATDGSTVDGRGAGINKLALLTRAEEVRAGAIRHALEMTITSTMFGAPACDPIRGTSAFGAGKSCGFFVSPATKLERLRPDTGCPGTQEVSEAARSRTVPEGMRFALRISDAEIEQWLDSRGYVGPKRQTARVFAVALRDYGWIAAETGCWGMSIETDSVIGAQGAAWAELGIVSDGRPYPHGDLLDGLFAPERIYVVTPPG